MFAGDIGGFPKIADEFGPLGFPWDVRLPGAEEVWAPRIDVYETADDLVVKVCAAGVRPKDIDISLSADNRFISIRGMFSLFPDFFLSITAFNISI